MPTPAVIERHDSKLIQPENWDEATNGHCCALPIRRETVDGVAFMRSAWDVETTEILRLLSGGKLILGVAGVQHPVVHMFVDALPADFQRSFTVRRLHSRGGIALVRVETLVNPPTGDAQRMWCEQPIDEGGISIAVGRSIELIECLARSNGWQL